MNKNQIQTSEILISKIRSEITKEQKEKIRNELYILMNPFLEKWITSILSKKGFFTDKPEVVSRSWDCFEFCLKHYKIEGKIPVPNHFYAYTKFYLWMSLKKEQKQSRKEILDFSEIANLNKGFFGEDGKIVRHDKNEIKDTVLEDEDSFLDVYEHIEELQSFKSMLPEEYKTVFDDAIMSMAPNSKDNLQRLEATTLSYSKYHEVKKVFKVVVEFLLLKGE